MIKEFVQPGGQAYLRLDLGEIEIKRGETEIQIDRETYLRLDLGEIEIKRGETEIQIDREREMTLKILSKAG